jgi:hypothetical protein
MYTIVKIHSLKNKIMIFTVVELRFLGKIKGGTEGAQGWEALVTMPNMQILREPEPLSNLLK